MSSTSLHSRTPSTSSTDSKRSPKRLASATSKSPAVASENSDEDDAKIGPPISNIFEALESDPGEAARLTLLCDLSIELERHIKAQGWTQKEAAKRLGVTQPRISDLMRGKISLFSIDALVVMLSKAGVRLEVTYRTAA